MPIVHSISSHPGRTTSHHQTTHPAEVRRFRFRRNAAPLERYAQLKTG